MKRGYLLLVFLMCSVVLLISASFASAQAVDCQIRAVCQGGWGNIAKVSADGHFRPNMAGSEPFTLCCRDVDTTSGTIIFNYSDEGHVSYKSSLTSFPNGFKLGFQDTCRLTSSLLDKCLNNIGEMCIFSVTASAPGVADNSHIAECGSGSLGVNLCCRRTEVCSNGIDDDDDLFIDCADEDCHNDFGEPQECTGSPLTSDACVSLTGIPRVPWYNPSCEGQTPPSGDAGLPPYYYCSYAESGPMTGSGVCCQSGKKARYNMISGALECVDYTDCGLDPTTDPCSKDFDTEFNPWNSITYNGNPLNWCNSRLPNFYTEDPPITERSTACCLIAKNGIVNYQTDNDNVKIFGTS